MEVGEATVKVVADMDEAVKQMEDFASYALKAAEAVESLTETLKKTKVAWSDFLGVMTQK